MRLMDHVIIMHVSCLITNHHLTVNYLEHGTAPEM